MKEVLGSYSNGSFTAFYVKDTDNGVVGLSLLPDTLAGRFSAEDPGFLVGNGDVTHSEPKDGVRVESLVQLKLVGDAYPSEYAAGQTMRNSDSSFGLRFVKQEVAEENGSTEILTVLQSDRVRAYHRLIFRENARYAWVKTSIENITESDQKVEMLSSFSIFNISPIEPKERIRDLNLYRLMTRWSGEGKLRKDRLLDLHMEPSWTRTGVNSLRYGQIGSMPTRGFFPWGVIEDEKYGCMVGAQLYYNGSWQMELYERDNRVALSGGIADREYGHFLKVMAPGEIFEAPDAVIAAVEGDVDEISDALVSAQNEAWAAVPESEKELPIIFNEYCTTWGNPTMENVEKIVGRIAGKGFKYLVIDAGWYSIGDGGWFADQGDWNVNAKRFPGGIAEAARKIREAGMIPGLWFELECIGRNAAVWAKTDWQLKRDGLPIEDGQKRFFDMKNPEVVAYLREKVIDFLKTNGFGYIKIDYNGNYGIGPDGGDSFGEELRKTVLATRDFFRQIREAIPEIVIENCASGGSRLEPSMMAVSSMASFSDAHECETIPIIAASLHRAILPKQSQIWAVMRAKDTPRRIYYSMINGLLGRLCLSGDIYDLDDAQWSIIDKCMAFYEKAAPVIRDGRTVISRDEQMDYNRPTGVQVVKRFGTGAASDRLLVVVHQFSFPENRIMIRIPEGYAVEDTCGESSIACGFQENILILLNMEKDSAFAVLFKKEGV